METFTDDTVVALASFLSPHDMLSLALTCKKFGDKHGTDKKRSAARDENTREVRQRTESVSLMGVAARTVLQTKWTDDEKKALPRHEDVSWIGIYQEFLSVFRLPLQFDKLVGDNMDYVDSSNKTTIYSKSEGQVNVCSAICNNIMRAGKHSVSFNIDNPTGFGGLLCGIMRPTTKDITSLTKCCPYAEDLSMFSVKEYETLYSDNNADCCLLSTFGGIGIVRRRWKKWERSELMAMNEEQLLQARLQNKNQSFVWEGMEVIRDETSFKIEFVLNLDEGTLDVYKNGRRLGTMRSGLVGEYCWVVSLRPDGSEYYRLLLAGNM